jgi:hypothetical protein
LNAPACVFADVNQPGAVNSNTASIFKHSGPDSFAPEFEQDCRKAVSVSVSVLRARYRTKGIVCFLDSGACRIKNRRQDAGCGEQTNEQTEDRDRNQQPEPFGRLSAGEVNADYSGWLSGECIRRDQLAVAIITADG